MIDIEFTPVLLERAIRQHCFVSFPLPELTGNISAGTPLPLAAVQKLSRPLHLLRTLAKQKHLALSDQCIIGSHAIQIPLGPSDWVDVPP